MLYVHIFTILSRECCPSCSGFLGQKSAQLMATVGYLRFYNVTCYLVFAIFSDYNVDLSVIILQLLCWAGPAWRRMSLPPWTPSSGQRGWRRNSWRFDVKNWKLFLKRRGLCFKHWTSEFRKPKSRSVRFGFYRPEVNRLWQLGRFSRPEQNRLSK